MENFYLIFRKMSLLYIPNVPIMCIFLRTFVLYLLVMVNRMPSYILRFKKRKKNFISRKGRKVAGVRISHYFFSQARVVWKLTH